LACSTAAGINSVTSVRVTLSTVPLQSSSTLLQNSALGTF
jgi:hypothetical protein